ncbi:MAG TPA: DUF2911 domain-containing protein [Gemmatimonadales bacterium]|nr:DUF2911 domain-containing protein [Gemmatimonadales bacterium]
MPLPITRRTMIGTITRACAAASLGVMTARAEQSGHRCRVIALAAWLAAGAGRPCAAQGMLSEHAVVAQTIAGTSITIEYYRPAARGRDSLFGKVVTWGEHWTPGANWATTIEVDHDVLLDGTRLPKGKYAIWTVVQPDRWTVELHRQWHKFHVPPPSDSSDIQLHLATRPQSGPSAEVLTFDFPIVRPAGTTLRFRWGTVVVTLDISAIAPALAVLGSSDAAAPFLGRYDVQVPAEDTTTSRRRIQVDVAAAGDTLLWRDADGPEAERRDFLLSPAGHNRFTPARRAADGQYWADSGTVVVFTMEGGRARSFEVQPRDGGTGSRGVRVR